MRVRQPKFDFTRTRAHWAPITEFAQMQNSTSLGIPHLERFLNRVMAKARSEIKGNDAESKRLRADINMFIKQESCHYSTHDRFNEVLIRDGYDRIPDFEREIEAHYAHLLETKSLAFLTAYCEGFETLGPPAAWAWLGGKMDGYLVGSDPNVAMMWQWHIMEEFEHRHVCHDVYHHVNGGYFLRVWAFVYQFYCMFSMAGKVQKYLLSVDRRGMTRRQIAESRRRERKAALALVVPMLKGMFRVFSPFYRPHDIATPVRFDAVEREVDADWMAPRSSTA